MTGGVHGLTDRRLHAVLAGTQRDGRLPSVVAGVVRDGALVWTGSHGAKTGGAAPDADLQYRIGSITKTMTSVLVLQLRDEGLIDLGDPLGRHLTGVDADAVPVRALLSHAGGLRSEPAGGWWERTPGGSFTDLVSANRGTARTLPIGGQHHYSNLGYGLLGELVARLRGEPWRDCVDRYILGPLAMTRTSYLPQPPAAQGYSVHHFAGTLTEEPATDTGAMAPAGQMWSTVEDLARYATFLAEGHPDVLERGSLLEASIPQAGTTAGVAAGGYGLGLRLLPGGSGMLVGHTGSMPGFLAALFVDRPRRTAAVALANATTGMPTESLAGDLLTTLEDCEPSVVEAWRPTEAVPAGVADVLGVWYWGNTALGFGYDGREVVVSGLQGGAELYRFLPDSPDRFVGTSGYHHGERLHAVRAAGGAVSRLECATFVYTRTPYDPEEPIPGGHPEVP